MAILEEILSFENIKQIIYFFQSLSIPEHYYLENWITYYIVLKTLLAAAIILYGSSILLKLSIAFDDLRPFALEASSFFTQCFTYFLIFGLLLFILGLPVPSQDEVTYLILICSALVVVLAIVMDTAKWYSGLVGIVGIFFVICLWLGGCFLALDVAYVTGSNDINGHIYTYMDSDYRDGDPISIKIGGPDTGLSVFLLHDDPEGLKQISSLYLYSNNSSTQFNNTLVGYSQGPGDYKISLNNTTSLPSGHYRLIFENPKYKWINTSNHFSLQN